MDVIDRSIIIALQENGRMTNVELARLNDLAPSSMLARVRRLEERGVIKSYRAIVDPKAVGLTVQAFVMINLRRHEEDAIAGFESRVEAIPEVKSCFHITGRYDYLLHLVARDVDHLAQLVKHTLASIPGIERQETFLSFSTVKDSEGYALGSSEIDGRNV